MIDLALHHVHLRVIVLTDLDVERIHIVLTPLDMTAAADHDIVFFFFVIEVVRHVSLQMEVLLDLALRVPQFRVVAQVTRGVGCLWVFLVRKQKQQEDISKERYWQISSLIIL